MKRYIISATKLDDEEFRAICADVAMHLKKFIEGIETIAPIQYSEGNTKELQRFFKQYYTAADFDTDTRTYNYIVKQLCEGAAAGEDLEELAESMDPN